MPTVLVTGAAGFIGSHTVRVCRNSGWDVVGLDRHPARPGAVDEHHVHDSTADQPLPPSLAGRRFDAAILLAWPVDPARYLGSTDNLAALAATNATAEALLAAGCRVVVAAGTCAEYAAPSTQARLREDDPLGPASLYAACKAAAGTVLAELCRQHAAVGTWARIFNPFGPGEPSARLIPSLVRTVAAGGTFAAGSGVQVRDYLHVDDVAAALACAARGGLPGPLNVCSGHGIRLADLMHDAALAAGAPADRVILGARPDRAWDPPSLVGDPSRLMAAGWRPRGTRETLPGYVAGLCARHGQEAP